MKIKILILLVIVLITGVSFFRWQHSQKPDIQYKQIQSDIGEITFQMSYKAMKFSGSVKVGGIRRQVIKGHTFEAFTQGQNIVLQIKAPDNSIVEAKTISFV